MPEGVGYGPQNTASVGLNLNVIGKHAYAYSGVVGITASETTLLNFQMGSSYLVATLQISYLALSSIDVNYRIYINDVVIQGYLAYETAGASEPDNLIPILVPPYATIKVTGTAATGNPDHVASLVGRIYGKI